MARNGVMILRIIICVVPFAMVSMPQLRRTFEKIVEFLD